MRTKLSYSSSRPENDILAAGSPGSPLRRSSATRNSSIKQMNDYASSKWVNELQIMNAQATLETETVRVRLFNTHWPEKRIVTIAAW